LALVRSESCAEDEEEELSIIRNSFHRYPEYSQTHQY
jgi:hypothetical protein